MKVFDRQVYNVFIMRGAVCLAICTVGGRFKDIRVILAVGGWDIRKVY